MLDPIDLAPVVLLAAVAVLMFTVSAGAFLRDLIRQRRRAR